MGKDTDLTSCPCCAVEHGIYLKHIKDQQVEIRLYSCHSCKSTWQTITYSDGILVLGAIVRTEQGERAAIGRNSIKARKLRAGKSGTKKSAALSRKRATA